MSSEKTFREVIRDIKENEIWCTDNTEIYLSGERILNIKPKNYYKNGDVNIVSMEFLVVDLTKKYKKVNV